MVLSWCFVLQSLGGSICMAARHQSASGVSFRVLLSIMWMPVIGRTEAKILASNIAVLCLLENVTEPCLLLLPQAHKLQHQHILVPFQGLHLVYYASKRSHLPSSVSMSTDSNHGGFVDPGIVISTATAHTILESSLDPAREDFTVELALTATTIPGNTSLLYTSKSNTASVLSSGCAGRDQMTWLCHACES